MDQPAIIDTKMHSAAEITACFLVHGERTALVETGPRSSVENVVAELEARGVDLDWIVVTHIHLDHAGAAGTLAKRYPDATVAVHEVGAPHLVDPTKLWKSAARIYGDDMERLWGGIDPIDRDRIHVLADGDKVDLGGRSLQAMETPGHAFHHHAFLDDATGVCFTGDALGVRLQDVGAFRPATPPPEFHLEWAISSIRRIRDSGATSLWPTHFGPSDTGVSPRSVEEACGDAVAALTRWEKWIRAGRRDTTELDEITKMVTERARASMEANLSPEQVERMESTTSYRMNTWGYMRYLDKQASI